MAAFSPTLRGRKVEPVSVSLRSMMGMKSNSVTLLPSKNAICTNRPTFQREQSDVLRDVLAADHVEDHVHAAHFGVRLHLSDEILGAVINDYLRARVRDRTPHSGHCRPW
jgi:hypothetical protein